MQSLFLITLENTKPMNGLIFSSVTLKDIGMVDYGLAVITQILQNLLHLAKYHSIKINNGEA